MIPSPDIKMLVPRFILNDRNGAALAAAIGKGLELFCEAAQEGIDNTLNVDKMPEWRLDEMAEEMGCVYDTDAEIEWKRRWIRNAYLNYLHIGTAAAIEEYLSAKLDGVKVLEWWKYGGSAYHFKVQAIGVTPNKTEWAASAIEKLKNVRSVYDGMEELMTGTLEYSMEADVAELTTKNASDELHTGDTYIWG